MLDYKTKQISRPISPHLTIYKWQISSVLSILHRMTGVALFFGFLFLSWVFIVCTITNNFSIFDGIVYQLLIIVLFLISIAYFYHLFNGIRHLIWDCGLFISNKGINITGWLVLIMTVITTVYFWLTIYLMKICIKIKFSLLII